jgi:hypothetical protein
MAATTPQLYSLFFAFIGVNPGGSGGLLAEEQEIDITRSTQSQAIETVLKGYAGESPGAPMQEVDIINAIPAGGFEFDAGANMIALIPVNIQLLGPGGKTNRGTGFVIKDTIRHGVNQAARYSFTVRMSMNLFQ